MSGSQLVFSFECFQTVAVKWCICWATELKKWDAETRSSGRGWFDQAGEKPWEKPQQSRFSALPPNMSNRLFLSIGSYVTAVNSTQSDGGLQECLKILPKGASIQSRLWLHGVKCGTRLPNSQKSGCLKENWNSWRCIWAPLQRDIRKVGMWRGLNLWVFTTWAGQHSRWCCLRKGRDCYTQRALRLHARLLKLDIAIQLPPSLQEVISNFHVFPCGSCGNSYSWKPCAPLKIKQPHRFSVLGAFKVQDEKKTWEIQKMGKQKRLLWLTSSGKPEAPRWKWRDTLTFQEIQNGQQWGLFQEKFLMCVVVCLSF